jgi:hypothetical protein
MKVLLLLINLAYILSDVVVKSPKELKEKFVNGTIKASLSNFGRIPYGYNLVGRLHYDPDNTDTEMACKNITTIDIQENHGIDEAPVVMVHRYIFY